MRERAIVELCSKRPYVLPLLVLTFALLGAPAPAAGESSGAVAYTLGWDSGTADNRRTHTWIGVADFAGRQTRALTPRPSATSTRLDYNPVFSPDGTRLAFLRTVAHGSGSGLYVAGLADGAPRRILALPPADVYWLLESCPGGSCTPPLYAWSPDGRRLAYANGRLVVVAADGSSSRELATHACAVSWAPDSRSLLYFSDSVPCTEERGANWGSPGFRRLNRVNVDGTGRRLLARGSFGGAAWSPDGRRIALTARCEVHHGYDWFCSQLVMNPDGGGRRTVGGSLGGGWIAWFDGGKQLLGPAAPATQATELASGRRHRMRGDLVGISADGKRLGAIVWPERFDWRSGRQTISLWSASGRPLGRIGAPPHWRYLQASLLVP